MADGQELFGRAVRAYVDVGAPLRSLSSAEDLTTAIVVESLRVKFKIKKTSSKEPNTAEIQIYNLSQDTRSEMNSKGSKVILEAGYTDSIEQIFSGDARFITHVREGADWVTKIDCGDGERVYNFLRVKESFRAGTPNRSIANRILDLVGLDATQAKGILTRLTGDALNGRVVNGNAMAELSRLIGKRFELSIQDGKVQILPLGEALAGEAILLSSSTGLVGSPEYGTSDKGPEAGDRTAKTKRVLLKVKSLLQPGIKCGRVVRVQSRQIDAQFRVETVEHVGDTAGGEWHSSLECSPIS